MSMSCKSWTYPETQALLDIWQQEHIQTQLTLMARNRPVWEQVAEIMKFRKGFNRTGEQCKTRIHTLKIRYNRAKKFGLSGPEAEKECPFYRQLDAVLGKNWVKKHEVAGGMSPTLPHSGISSLYPLTFSPHFDRINNNGMVQILPKPIPKYVDTSFTKGVQLEEMMGQHSSLIKRMLSTLSKEPRETTTPTADHGFEDLIKSLCSPISGSSHSLLSNDKTAFSPASSLSPDMDTSPVSARSIPTSLSTTSQRSGSFSNAPGNPEAPTPSSPHVDVSPTASTTRSSTHPSPEPCLSRAHVQPEPWTHANKRRRVSGSEADRLVLLGSIAQIINNIAELNRNIKLSQEQEEKKMAWLMEIQEKRLHLEQDHFKAMEGLFASLLSCLTGPEVLKQGLLGGQGNSLCSEST